MGSVQQTTTLPQTETREVPWIETSRKQNRKFETKRLRQALEAALQENPAPSMQEVAQRLEYDPSHLRKHFPDLCQAISRRYLASQGDKKEKRLQRQYGEVREAVRELHRQGRYPSWSQLKKILPKPGILREAKVRAAWHETMQELGWN